MKKLLSVIGILILAVGLTACRKADKTTSSSSSSSKISKTSSASSSTTSSSSSSVTSSDSLKTESGSQTDLAQARNALYQAGINSADISDEQILQWWNTAKSQGKDFVDYVQSQIQ